MRPPSITMTGYLAQQYCFVRSLLSKRAPKAQVCIDITPSVAPSGLYFPAPSLKSPFYFFPQTTTAYVILGLKIQLFTLVSRVSDLRCFPWLAWIAIWKQSVSCTSFSIPYLGWPWAQSPLNLFLLPEEYSKPRTMIIRSPACHTTLNFCPFISSNSSSYSSFHTIGDNTPPGEQLNITLLPIEVSPLNTKSFDSLTCDLLSHTLILGLYSFSDPVQWYHLIY